MPAILSVKNLNFSYGKIKILSNITFDVDKGDYIGLAGPNGAGKTTLIKTVLGLAGKYEGSVELFGQPFNEFRDWEKIGYLPQRVNVFNRLFPAKVEEVVRLGLLSSKHFPKKFTLRDKEKILNVLDVMGIADLKDKPVSELSGGQQQRVFLCRALVCDPEFLILDEPGTALDPQTREDFFQTISRLNKEQKTAIILITHDTSYVGQYANKLLYLDKEIVFYGNFTDFCKSPEMEKQFGHFAQHIVCHQHD